MELEPKEFQGCCFDFQTSDQGLAYFKQLHAFAIQVSQAWDPNHKCTLKVGMKIDVQAPSFVQDYSSHMGGVDRADMLQSL
jgi:hypothetical protein